MDKLWKGIFYCALLSLAAVIPDLSCKGFWMSDKPLVQQALASELAELILTISLTAASLAFIHGFWETTVREWNGIDHAFVQCIYINNDLFIRIDKYYMLICRFTNATFRLFIRAKWDKDAYQGYNHILSTEGGPCRTRKVLRGWPDFANFLTVTLLTPSYRSSRV